MTKRRASVLILVTATGLLTACSGGGGFSSGSAASGVGASPPAGVGASLPAAAIPSAGASSASAGTPGQVLVRFGNFFTLHGKPGPALDIYDTQQGVRAKPLVTDLAYGAVSDYVRPRKPANIPNAATSLYALPAGEDPVAKMSDGVGLGGVLDDGSHPQITTVLTGEKDAEQSGPLAALSFSAQVEKGTFNGSRGPLAPPAEAGKAEFLASIDPVSENGVLNGAYLLVDTSCAPPLNGDPNEGNLPDIFAADGVAPVSSYAVFAQPPGSHTVAVAQSDISTNLTCADLTVHQSPSTQTLTAGEQVLTFVYGTSKTDLHLAFAPIKQ